MTAIQKHPFPPNCRKRLLAIQDTIDLLSGKWTMKIIVLLFFETTNFMELKRRLKGIGPKMLAQELKKLEVNGIVNRTVLNEKPLSVHYELTPHGLTLISVIESVEEWGHYHRKAITAAEPTTRIFGNEL